MVTLVYSLRIAEVLSQAQVGRETQEKESQNLHGLHSLSPGSVLLISFSCSHCHLIFICDNGISSRIQIVLLQ